MTLFRLLLFLAVVLSIEPVYSAATAKKHYQFQNELIDVVIPCTNKDQRTLNLCIAGIKENCAQIKRIIVISDRPYTDQAEWFDESEFPFDKRTVALHLTGSESGAKALLNGYSRVGWYYQQLLKLYSPFVIPGISSNVLVLDADTVFLRPVDFIDDEGRGLYNPGTEYHLPYFAHAQRLLPGLDRIFPEYSGISHHMLLQYAVLEDLVSCVETHHRKSFWQAFCECVDPGQLHNSGASEYEIYFNFAFSRTSQLHIRSLKWDNIRNISDIPLYKAHQYDYVSCHNQIY